MGGSERRRGRARTEDEERVGEGAEDGEEESADEPRPHDLEQQLAARGQVRGGLEHEEAVDEGEEEVPEHGGGAGEEAVRLLALLLRRRRRGRRGEADHRDERRRRGAVGDEAAVRGGGHEGEKERDQREGAAGLPAGRHCRCAAVVS